MQIVRSAGRRDRLDIADAPGGIPRAQAGVERSVARCRVRAILPKRTVEVEYTPSGSVASAPAISPMVASQGAMWIMLIATTASTRVTGHG
jgi:hypothetical protein